MIHIKEPNENGVVVGDRKREEYAMKLADIFFKAEMQYYPESRAGEAWEWVNA